MAQEGVLGQLMINNVHDRSIVTPVLYERPRPRVPPDDRCQHDWDELLRSYRLSADREVIPGCLNPHGAPKSYLMPGDVPGFGRTRGPHVVRLKRSSDGTPPEGMYKCVVRDTTDINQTVYVGIYSQNGM